MTKQSQTLGGRLPLADPATLTGAQRDLFQGRSPRCPAPVGHWCALLRAIEARAGDNVPVPPSI